MKSGHAEEFESAGSDVGAVQHFDAFTVFVKDGNFGGGGDTVKNLILRGQFQIFVGGVALTIAFFAAGRIVNARKDHAVGAFVGKRLQQDVVDHAEDGSGGADTQRQGGDGNGGE